MSFASKIETVSFSNQYFTDWFSLAKYQIRHHNSVHSFTSTFLRLTQPIFDIIKSTQRNSSKNVPFFRPTKPCRSNRTIKPSQKLKPQVRMPSPWRLPQTWGGFNWDVSQGSIGNMSTCILSRGHWLFWIDTWLIKGGCRGVTRSDRGYNVIDLQEGIAWYPSVGECSTWWIRGVLEKNLWQGGESQFLDCVATAKKLGYG